VTVSDDKTPVDQALDLVFYAPLGLVFSLGELVPKLAEKGRQQMTMARMVGEFAAKAGAQEAEKLVGRALRQAEGLLGGARPPAPRPDRVPTGATPAAAPAETVPTVRVATTVAPARTPDPAPPVQSLGIPGYDTLSASQVVQRLAGLSREELEAVRAYEAAGRSRKTILNRVSQLQGSNGAG
jgi:hypothetical protein